MGREGGCRNSPLRKGRAQQRGGKARSAPPDSSSAPRTLVHRRSWAQSSIISQLCLPANTTPLHPSAPPPATASNHDHSESQLGGV